MCGLMNQTRAGLICDLNKVPREPYSGLTVRLGAAAVSTLIAHILSSVPQPLLVSDPLCFRGLVVCQADMPK